MKPHRCSHPECNRSFDRPYRLMQHLLSHDNLKFYVCQEDGCNKSYSSKSHLNRHINSSHKHCENNVIYSCPNCQNVYANRQNLKRHLKICHSADAKPRLSCDICKIHFQKKHQLSSHMYGHTGIMPFSCEDCHKEFVTLYEKKRHRRFHRTHTCNECGLKFNHWSKFKQHLATHLAGKEFICNECGRKFKQRVHIVRHVKQHNPPRVQQFPCPYQNCTRSYSRNSNLTQHIAIKHEKLRQECEICNAQLSTNAKLREHMLKLHSGIPVEKKTKPKNPRKVRKDAGSFKSSTALKLAGIEKTMLEFQTRFSSINYEDIGTSSLVATLKI